MTKVTNNDVSPTGEADCVFCERIKNEEYDDRFANHVIFEPLNPVTEGHKLVVPVPHTPHLNTGELEADQTGWALRYFTNDLDQYNIITSKGSNATQTIQHLHFHIVPRTEVDGLLLPWSNQANTESSRELAPPSTESIDTLGKMLIREFGFEPDDIIFGKLLREIGYFIKQSQLEARIDELVKFTQDMNAVRVDDGFVPTEYTYIKIRIKALNRIKESL